MRGTARLPLRHDTAWRRPAAAAWRCVLPSYAAMLREASSCTAGCCEGPGLDMFDVQMYLACMARNAP